MSARVRLAPAARGPGPGCGTLAGSLPPGAPDTAPGEAVGGAGGGCSSGQRVSAETAGATGPRYRLSLPLTALCSERLRAEGPAGGRPLQGRSWACCVSAPGAPLPLGGPLSHPCARFPALPLPPPPPTAPPAQGPRSLWRPVGLPRPLGLPPAAGPRVKVGQEGRPQVTGSQASSDRPPGRRSALGSLSPVCPPSTYRNQWPEACVP